MIIEITDVNAKELHNYAKATEHQLVSDGVFIAESPYVIDLALKAGCVPLSFLVQKTMLECDVVSNAKDVPVYTADDEILTRITGFKLTLGVLCEMKRPQGNSVFEICQNSSRLAVLEHVMNPTNVGAIFRSAAALGFDGVLLSHDCADPLYRRSARVSMGSVFQIPWAYFDKNEPYLNIEYLRKNGFKTLAMALTDNSLPIDDERFKNADRLAVVLGSEGEGLTDKTLDRCDFTVKIPMHHGVDSLNVAAASAVIFWQLKK